MNDALSRLFEANNTAIKARKEAEAAEQKRIQTEKAKEELDSFERNITQALGSDVLAVLDHPLFYQKSPGKCTFNFTARNFRLDLTQVGGTMLELEPPSYIGTAISSPRFAIDSPTAREQFLSGLESVLRFL